MCAPVLCNPWTFALAVPSIWNTGYTSTFFSGWNTLSSCLHWAVISADTLPRRWGWCLSRCFPSQILCPGTRQSSLCMAYAHVLARVPISHKRAETWVISSLTEPLAPGIVQGRKELLNQYVLVNES